MGIFTLSLALTVVVRWSLGFILRTVAKKTKTDLDDILIRAAKNVVTYSVPVIGLMAALTPLALQTAIPQRMLFSLLVVLLMRGVINLINNLSKWLEKTSAKRTESTMDEGLLPLLRKTLKTIVVILGVLIILGKWEIQIGPLVGALGIGGLAIALALNSSLANIFSGIQLILDRSINVGDKVKLESGDVGVVLDIGLRCTRIQTYDNEVISLPNSQLANAQVKNYTKPDATIRV
ncbi:MAG: mechanosensitive ion channel family protein, partial [candidate division Zixibacteria bacterium]|nr:mechanosensitive ion channel family protein [candidate division Zixibacteria bacterium]